TSQIVRQALSWEQMRPLYLEVYRKTFTAEEVRGITRFYQSRAGQSLLDKTPALTQNLMQAMEQKMIPMLEQLQGELQTVAEEKAKAAPAKKKKSQ
ncbi:MAG: DUF2059 domain-containing protein, partial [Pseudoxanthomonas sp.]|nr:DUF2059 domain-containing protein [Pseudoxanthomonas sp.]